MSTLPQSHFASRRKRRRTPWAVTAFQVGALTFAGGLTLLHLNPFWHFDESGFLDWRVHWWNGAAEIAVAVGLAIALLAVAGLLAELVAHFAGRKLWTYAVAALLLAGAAIWVSMEEGPVRDVEAYFEWNAADGFNVFHLQSWDEAAQRWRPAGGEGLQSFVAMQIEPLLRGYFKLNDWRKMNGEVNLKLISAIPAVLPVGIGKGDETLQDPDETLLMRAARAGDVKKAQELLADDGHGTVNALDQRGESALILACENPKTNPEMVRALIAAGADLNLRSRNGYTALTWAMEHKNDTVVRILWRAGGRR